MLTGETSKTSSKSLTQTLKISTRIIRYCVFGVPLMCSSQLVSLAIGPDVKSPWMRPLKDSKDGVFLKQYIKNKWPVHLLSNTYNPTILLPQSLTGTAPGMGARKGTKRCELPANSQLVPQINGCRRYF